MRVPLLNFEEGPGVLLLNFEGGPEVPCPGVLVPLLDHATWGHAFIKSYN